MRIQRVLLTSMLMGAAACNSSGGDSAGDEIVGPTERAGTYTLRAVNNQSLPTTISGLTYRSGYITLTSAGLYSGQMTTRESAASSDQVENFSGDYQASSGSQSVTFNQRLPTASSYSGTLMGSVLTINVSDGTFRFER